MNAFGLYLLMFSNLIGYPIKIFTSKTTNEYGKAVERMYQDCGKKFQTDGYSNFMSEQESKCRDENMPPKPSKIIQVLDRYAGVIVLVVLVVGIVFTVKYFKKK